MENVNLRNKIQRRESHLRHRLGALKKSQFNTEEEFYETRAKLQREYNETIQKRLHLDHEHDIEIRNGKIARAKALIQQSIDKERLIIEKNYMSLPIDKGKLTVRVPFTNCAHVEELPLESLIPFDKERLWQDLIKGTAIQVHRNCEACRKAKRSLRAKFGKWNDRPIGHAILTIRGLR